MTNGRAPTHVRTRLLRFERRLRVSRLYIQGKNQQEIAAAEGVHFATVSRDLKRIQQDWMREATVNFDEARSRELAKIDELERTYWEAWDRSTKYKTSKERSTTAADSPQGSSSRDVKKERAELLIGDPRYLAGVQWCISKRCELLQLVVTGDQGVYSVTSEDLDYLEIEELLLVESRRLSAQEVKALASNRRRDPHWRASQEGILAAGSAPALGCSATPGGGLPEAGPSPPAS